MKICAMCGRSAECTHHLIFGSGLRKIADEDNITIDLCNQCHNLGKDRIHENPAAEKLSKMLGQALWELDHVGYQKEREQARADFMKRYGRSYL